MPDSGPGTKISVFFLRPRSLHLSKESAEAGFRGGRRKKEFYNFTISFNYELIDEEKLKVQEELKSYAINYFTNNIKEVNAKNNKCIKIEKKIGVKNDKYRRVF